MIDPGFEPLSPFSETADTPVLDFGSHLFWVSKPEWAGLFMLGRGVCVRHSPRFTSGATPANLFVANVTVKLFSSTYLQASIGEAQNPNQLTMSAQMLRVSVFFTSELRISKMKKNFVTRKVKRLVITPHT